MTQWGFFPEMSTFHTERIAQSHLAPFQSEWLRQQKRLPGLHNGVCLYNLLKNSFEIYKIVGHLMWLNTSTIHIVIDKSFPSWGSISSYLGKQWLTSSIMSGHWLWISGRWNAITDSVQTSQNPRMSLAHPSCIFSMCSVNMIRRTVSLVCCYSTRVLQYQLIWSNYQLFKLPFDPSNDFCTV